MLLWGQSARERPHIRGDVLLTFSPDGNSVPELIPAVLDKMEEGYDRMKAVTAAYVLAAMPMLTGTLITAVGFLPIGIAKSAVGEYTFAIFAVTAAALIISWFVSVLFVAALGIANALV